MCGRFAIAAPKFERIEEALGVSFAPLKPRYNIAPTTSIPVIGRDEQGRYRLAPMRWGLVPHWSREPSTKFSTFNARAESAAEKPAFRDSFRRRRCVIPITGFYEWKRSGSDKKPYFITSSEGEGLALAGLWDRWSGVVEGQERELFSCTILVGPPNEALAPIHDRMPIILPPGELVRWLDPELGQEEAEALCAPLPAEKLKLWPVGARVGNVRNDNPSLLEPVEEA